MKRGDEDLTLIEDKEVQKLCEEVGAYKYMSCSAYKGTGLKEIFDEVCQCWYDMNHEEVPKRTKNCILL